VRTLLLSKRGIAAIVVAGGIALAAVAWVVLARAAPAGFSSHDLASAPPPAHSTATPMPDPLLAPCLPRLQAPPDSDAVTERWLTVAGSEIGFRARERFAQLQGPHEAVERTDVLAGGMLLTRRGPALTMAAACFAVEPGALRSVDTIPGMNVSDRDEITRDIVESGRYPLATLFAHDLQLPADAASGRQIHVTTRASAQLHGVTREVSLTMDARQNAGSLAIVGSFPLDVRDYAMEAPNGPIEVDPHMTIEFRLFLRRG
jgi:hypothetical protein